jgi:hypothetical protein
MDTMILGSDHEWIVGEQYPAMESNQDGTVWTCPPFVVLRLSSFGEWLKSAWAQGRSPKIETHHEQGYYALVQFLDKPERLKSETAEAVLCEA